MNHFSKWIALLAGPSPWHHLGDRVSGRNAELSGGEVLGLVGFATAAVLLILWLQNLLRRQDPMQPCSKPKLLFPQLSDAHQLTKEDRKLLKRLAAARKIENPAELFMRPDAFTLNGLPNELAASDAVGIFSLRDRLFRVEEAR